jgi:DNA-directed RNA polymerase I, II, and III subunit RPABC2
MSLEENEEDIKNLSGDEGASEAGSAASSASEAAESSAAGDDVADLSDFDISEAEDDDDEEEVTKNPEEEAGSGASEALDTSVTHPASISKKTSTRKTSRKSSNKKGKKEEEKSDDDDDDDDDEDEDDNEKENYLQKFDKNFRNEFIKQYHPESNTHNYEQVKILTSITRDGERITDGIHKTLPFLTKYEKTRVLGQRAKQINAGAKPMIDVAQNIMDGYIIAKLELEQKKIPFIIKRPLPNGECEYWNLADLELIN